jgi:hypothetical protein
MEKHCLKATVSDDRRLVINGLPFSPGDTVEITIQVCYDKIRENCSRYPLRGKPFRYADPFGSAADDEWEALK